MSICLKTGAVLLCAAAIFTACNTPPRGSAPAGSGGQLPITGAYNVRDIGGYTGAGGRTVRYGRLIRSGDLHELTAGDQEYLFNTIGIKTVVDFRSAALVVGSDLRVSSERLDEPGLLPASVRVWPGDTGIPQNGVVPDYDELINDTAITNIEVIDMVRDGYVRLLNERRGQYLEFFNAALASNGEPLLYHCSAGKDRAGVATALMFLALGVPREDIIANYLLSAELVAGKYAHIPAYVTESVSRSMQGRKQLAAALAVNAPGTEEALTASVTQTIKQRTMQNALDVMLGQGVPEGTAIIQARAQADAFAASPQGQAAITGAAAQARAQMAPLAGMPDAAIQEFAQAAGEKITPLLTVYRSWIVAALDEIDRLGGIGAYLDGIDIARLRDLYLE